MSDNSFLKAISDENATGHDIRYSSYYDIFAARNKQRMRFLTKEEKADWSEVITLCTDILTYKSKDLNVCVWLWDALTRKLGFEGFLQGMEIINDIVNTFGKEIFPKDKEMIEFCANWADEKMIDSMMEVEIFKGRSICDDIRDGRAVNSHVDHETIQKKVTQIDDIISKLNHMTDIMVKTFDSTSWHLTKLKQNINDIRTIFLSYLGENSG